MATFKPDASKPIVWNWIHNDLEICSHEILSAIEHERDCEKTDLSLGFGSTAIGVLSTALLLGLAGVGIAMVPPVALAVAGALHGYNSGVRGRRRELESEFIADYPDILKAIESKLDEGQASSRVASAYESIFRLYRRGDDEGIIKVLGKSESQTIAQQGIQPSDNEGMTREKGEALASTEIQPIAIAQDETVDKPIAAAPSFTSPNLTPPQTRSELIARLKQDCPLLLKLVKSHPIRAVGVQRSGKTTLVKRLALLRMVLLEGHSVTASTPHYEEINQYPDQFTIAGIRNGQRDYPAIERAWSKMASDVESCQMGNITYVWDEFGLIDKAIPITPESDPIKTVLTSCLRETMKFQIYPIFILHGETAAFLPGSKGLVTVIMASTVRVETIGEPVEGEDGLEMIRPTGRFNVTWLDGSKGEGVLPAWLSEDFLIGMIPDRKITKEPIAPPPPSSDGPYADDIRGTWREEFAKNMPPNIDEAEFLRRYNLEKSLQESSSLETTYQSSSVSDIELEPVEKSHPLEDKFVRLEAMLEGQESIAIRDISRAFTCKSDEAVQLAQMFCMSQKSRFKFSQITKPNGTVSKSIDRV